MALSISTKTPGVLAALAAIEAVKSKVGVHLTWVAGDSTTAAEFKKDGVVVSTATYDIAHKIALLSLDIGFDGGSSAAQVNEWMQTAGKLQANLKDYVVLSDALDRLNEHLKLRSYIVGYHLTVADVVFLDIVKSSPIIKKSLQAAGAEEQFAHVLRWQVYVESHDCVQAATAAFAAAEKEFVPKRKDQGSFEINLTGARKGQVVTRFPPEPSGYLHIGHVKAALLNEYFARLYEGKLIIRFDDTNPSKEKEEFEHAILEDLQLLKIKGDEITWTSNWFGKLLEIAWQMIRDGQAYVDDTPVDEMRAQRMDGIASKNRNNSIEENLKRFQQMVDGTDYGKTCCLRAKMSVDNNNKAMRDPVMYRCNETPHARTGTTYKVYPTYDFACPVVDSIEGVTHALRTNEYRDRNDQYYWFIDALKLRKPLIWDYSRMNFVYTLLSKRKLTWFVDNRHVSGWDDPRFPTVRGILRRGMTVEALKEYILMQGASVNVLNLEWDKLWSLNRKLLDPISSRHTAVSADNFVPWKLSKAPVELDTKEVLKHKKNEQLGVKTTYLSSNILIDYEDAKDLQEGEEVTLMDWGNAIVRKVVRDATSQKVIGIEGDLHLEGDFKKTKKKLTWLASEGKLINATLMDYDYLITKEKLEEDDTFTEFLNPVTEFKSEVVVDNNLQMIKHGDFIQLERRGFYRCDRDLSSGQSLVLILVPDGKMKAMSTLATNSSASKVIVTKTVEEKKEKKQQKQSADTAAKKKAVASNSNNVAAAESASASVSLEQQQQQQHQVEPILYSVHPLYDMSVTIDTQMALSGMYAVRPAYADLLQ